MLELQPVPFSLCDLVSLVCVVGLSLCLSLAPPPSASLLSVCVRVRVRICVVCVPLCVYPFQNAS
jgi:hypothetical protein